MSASESEKTGKSQTQSRSSSTSSQQSLRTPDASQSHMFYQSGPYPFSYMAAFGAGDGTWSSSNVGLDTTSFLQALNPSGSEQQTLMTDQVLAGGLNHSYMSSAPLVYPNPSDYSALNTGGVTVSPQNAASFPFSQFGLFGTPMMPGTISMPTAATVNQGQKAEGASGQAADQQGGNAAAAVAVPVSASSNGGAAQDGVENSFGKLSVSEGGGSSGEKAQETAPRSSGVKSWAAIASQPAKQGVVKPKPKPQVGFGNAPPTGGGGSGQREQAGSQQQQQSHGGFGQSSTGSASQQQPWGKQTGAGRGRGWSNQRRVPSAAAAVNGGGPSSSGGSTSGLTSIHLPPTTSAGTATGTSGGGGGGGSSGSSQSASSAGASVLDRLRSANQYNPKEFVINLKNARFFVIKSYSEDDIHRSIKYSIWTSTPSGNRRLNDAFREQNGDPLYLLYSVNGSGHFCGVAQMTSQVDYEMNTGVFTQEKWKGKFDVKWVYVKDVPNNQLRHIRLENNENKPVTNSRDTQEVLYEKGKQILRIVHNYKATTSIFDDFGHYEKRQEEDNAKK
eukprot:m.3916 g.3916  ORF g.3916 m.3916 type:complete len:560 (+) comp9980_c0_seq1:124-1803(+)